MPRAINVYYAVLELHPKNDVLPITPVKIERININISPPNMLKVWRNASLYFSGLPAFLHPEREGTPSHQGKAPEI